MLTPWASLTAHRRLAYGAAFSADGALLCTSGYDGTVRVWPVADGHLLHTLRGDGPVVLATACAPTGPVAASGGAGDNRIRLCDPRTGALTRILPAHGRHKHLAFRPTAPRSPAGAATARCVCGRPRSGVLGVP